MTIGAHPLGVGAAALVLSAFFACADLAVGATARVSEPVMGTVLEATVVAADPGVARELAHDCIRIARHWEDVLTTWRPQGELEQLNLHAGRGPVAIGSDLQSALERMLSLSRATGGVFEPGVGAVVAALRDGLDASESGRPPTLAPMRDALTLAGGKAILRAGARLDAGGIGKGIALDAIDAHLHANGADAWFLNFGGSSQLARRRPESANAWHVVVAGEGRGKVHGLVRLRDSSLSTSRALAATDPAGTIIDPRSGEPVPPPRLGTVLAPDATTAEAWSKVLIVLGRDGVDAVASAGLEALYEDSSGSVVTANFPLERTRGFLTASGTSEQLDFDGGEQQQ